MSDVNVCMHKHTILGGLDTFSSRKIKCSEIASGAILGRKQSWSSYVICRVLYPVQALQCWQGVTKMQTLGCLKWWFIYIHIHCSGVNMCVDHLPVLSNKQAHYCRCLMWMYACISMQYYGIWIHVPFRKIFWGKQAHYMAQLVWMAVVLNGTKASGRLTNSSGI